MSFRQGVTSRNDKIMRNIKLKISYDGTNYVGWQVQPNGASIQSIIEGAIFKITGEKISIMAASRTDSGVHALAQVAHLFTNSNIPERGLRDALNSLLPDDIAIVDVSDMPLEFHAKRDSRGKRYLYRLLVGGVRTPLFANRCWHVRDELNLAEMALAKEVFIGTHDFESFRASGCTAKDAIRTVTRIDIKTNDSFSSLMSGGGSIVDITFEGNSFVRHMIRNLVGAIVEVGKGKISPDELNVILENRNRNGAPICAPSCGLYLMEVFY